MPRSNIIKLDITIDQDWTKLISIYKNIVQRWEDDKLPDKTYLDDVKTYHYNLGDLGSLTALDEISSEKKKASFLHGKVVETNLPWVKKLREDLSELNLSSLCLFYSSQNVLQHVDSNGIADRPNDICKINFFLQDSDSVIYVENNGEVESAPAVANTGWLLDVVHPHWTTSTRDLFMLQLCFYNTFDEVLEWFNAHPGLSYS